MQLVFLGYPGSGKGTQAALLSEEFKIPKISTGDILRSAVQEKTELGIKAKEFMNRGELVPDEIIFGLVIERVSAPDSSTGYILDGFPRTIIQAHEFDRLLLTHNKALNAVISLEIEKKKVIQRLTSRRVCEKCGKLYNLLTDPPSSTGECRVCGGKTYQRSDDKPETVLHRMEVYEELTRPLKDYYGSQGKLMQIDGGVKIDRVYGAIKRRLAKFT